MGGAETPYGLKFEHDEKYQLRSEVVYECEHCQHRFEETIKSKWYGDRSAHKWVAEAPFVDIAGFWINALYAPLGWRYNWRKIVREFLKCKQTNDHQLLKAFVNTVLAETW